jgi:hypothetical protein
MLKGGIFWLHEEVVSFSNAQISFRLFLTLSVLQQYLHGSKKELRLERKHAFQV